MSITGESDSNGGGPQKVGIAVADVMTGMYATVAILAALHYRQVSGEGQYIDVALLDCIVAFGGNQVVSHLAAGGIPRRYGNAHASLVPYQVFATKDSQIIVAAGNDGQWQRLCKAIDRTDLGADARFAMMKGRVEGRDELIPDLSRTFLTQSTEFWIGRLDAADVPCGPINDYSQVFADPQVRHRGIRIDLPRTDGSSVPTAASPLRLMSTPPRYDRAPPTLGEHTDEILKDMLVKSDAEIADLRRRGII